MSEAMQPGLLAESDIFSLKESLIQTAVGFILYGIYSALVIIVLYKLWTNKAQLAADHILITAVIIMFIASTTQIFISLAFYLIQLPTLGFDPPNNERLLIIMSILTATMTRLNYFIGDSTVVWRAWKLWTNHPRVHTLLCICLIGTFAGVTVDFAFAILFELSQFSDSPRFSPLRSLILTIPLFLTNIISTLVIAYQVWEYKVEIKRNLGRSRNKRTKAERVLILLMESGSIYCLLWLSMLVFGLKSSDNKSLSHALVGGILPQLAIYPIIIILLITLQKANLESTVYGPSFFAPDFTISHIDSVTLDPDTDDRLDPTADDT
ncbi:hypothetical protein C8J56DRAFT_1060356 [Mycena floridula]|nr:hypothetical protein C8J56DRAFT_1060356 [Mycena floridula]